MRKVRRSVREGEILPPERKGSRGPLPYADALATVGVTPVEGEVVRDREGGGDPPLLRDDERLTDAVVRVRVLERAARLVDSGTFSASQAMAVAGLVRVAQREKPASTSPPVTVRMGVISTDEEADAVRRGDYGPTDARELH